MKITTDDVLETETDFSSANVDADSIPPRKAKKETVKQDSVEESWSTEEDWSSQLGSQVERSDYSANRSTMSDDSGRSTRIDDTWSDEEEFSEDENKM